jgi:methionine sulfoxide reductase heme-binding subunit
MVLKRIDWTWFSLKFIAHVLAVLPAGLLVYQALNNQLGADPIAALTHQTGDWALRFLLLSLAMTPLRLILKKSWPIRFRRMIGLYAFFYACLHFSVYLFLDLGSYWSQIGADIIKRPFITVGFTAWLLLLPLALTSTQWMMRKLKKNWLKLHKLVYAIGILGVVHYYWLVKSDVREPLMYAGILALLFAIRLKPRLHSWLENRRVANHGQKSA